MNKHPNVGCDETEEKRSIIPDKPGSFIKKKWLNREDREAVKKVAKKIISTARAALEIYYSARKKDPILIGLSMVSAYEAAENLLMKEEGETLHQRLIKMGLDRIVLGMEKLVFQTLLELDILYTIPIVDRSENDSGKVLLFDIYGTKLYVLIEENYVSGIYAEDEDKFIESFSKLLCEKLGNIVAINVYTENWNANIKLSSVDIPLETYVCQIDVKEYCETINKFRKMELNRSSLLYGRPGCGKTSFSAKIANELKGRLVVIDAQALNYASRQGWSLILQKLIKLLSPAVVLFDDIDRLGEDELGFLLSMVENLNRYKDSGEIIIMASVNDLDELPEAMKRPGRFDEIVLFADPDYDQRKEILLTYLKHFGTRLADAYVEEMALLTENLTPAYLREIALQATVTDYVRIPKVIAHMKLMLGIEDEVEDEENGEDFELDGRGEDPPHSSPRGPFKKYEKSLR